MAGTLRRRVAMVVVVGLALALGASASANIDASHTVRTVATAGDCDGNGTPDVQEAAWRNRDDDGDGFCNGVDACPYEATATNDDSACQMQAITVPFKPSDPSKPHPTYSGASITLKGIARYGGTEFSWDYGDGSPAMPWTAIGDRFNLGVKHVYTGNAGDEFTATLSVRNSANPDVVATATYPVQIEDATDLTDPAQVDVRAAMAADESLWWLHTQMSRGQFTDGAPGENQSYGLWNQAMSTTCAALDALETHGSTPGSNWSSDPYVEDTQRALAYVFYNSNGIQIFNQPYGNPDVNGNGLGITLGATNDTYTNAVCAIALADSASPGRTAATGRAGIYGRTYADVEQDAVDWFSYGQEDTGYARGAWGYYANSGGANGETFRWPVFAMDDASRELNTQIPAFIRQNIPYFLAYSHYTALDPYNGGWGWASPTAYTSDGFTAAGIAIHFFLGDSKNHPDVQRGLGFLYRHWNDPPPDGLFGNLGDSDAMYTTARALHEAGLSQVTDFDYVHGVQTSNSFDWFHATPADGHEGYGVYLVTSQRPDGSFVDAISGAGTHGNGVQWSTAWDTMVLAMAPAAVAAPTANAGGPYSVAPSGTVTLDATRSIDPTGGGLTYAWDLSGNGLYTDSTSPTPTFTAGAVPAGTVYPVCVRVTGAGGSATACSTVTVQAAALVAQIVSTGVVSGPLPRDVTLDGSHSSGGAGGTLTYAWTVDDPDGTTTGATSAVATHTFHHYGTYAVHLLVSDGLLTSAADTSVAVVDTTPPTLTVPGDLMLTAGSTVTQEVNDWLNSATATDDDPDHPAATVTNDFSGVAAGTQTITWTATDAAGNTTKKSASLTVQNDTSPPDVEPHIDGTKGDNDWYTSDVHVTWLVSDPGSAFTTTGCGATDVTSDTDTAGVTLTCTATSAGGKTTDTITVRRDATPPKITATRAPAANGAGWNSSDVTVTYTCSDTLSGIAHCDTPTVLHEGTAQSATGTAIDNAGNHATATVDPVNVDETAPSLSGAPTTPPNIDGWYAGDVSIHWACSDAGGSGIAGGCPADSTIGGEGHGLTDSASVADVAGNVTAAASAPVSIDRTPPSTGVSAPSGWTNAGVTVTLAATDNLSGVAATYYSLDGAPAAVGTTVPIDAEGTHTLTYWSVDRADNVEQTHRVQVLIDKSAPTITHKLSPLPNAAGWNNSDVTVTFACADSDSGIAFCSPLQLLTGEGAALPVSGTAKDTAGNVATDAFTVAIDRTPPTVHAAADRTPNAHGWYDADVVVSFTCDDGLSGVASCAPPVTLREGRNQSASGSAKDVAGNAASGTLTGVDVDETPPTVTYTGNAGSYTIDQNVSIHCAAADALSGVDSTTCADIVGLAASFGLGPISRSATATDLAGNVGTGSVSFTVGVTCGSLRGLVTAWVKNKGIANALLAKLDGVCGAPNADAKSGKLTAFDNQVEAQAGKGLTVEHADLLEQYAATL